MSTTNILLILQENKKTNPEGIALIQNDEVLTYRELKSEIDSFTLELRNAGFMEHCPIGLFIPNVFQYIISYLGILQFGGIVVPLNIMSTDEELNRIVHQAKVCGIIYWEKFQKRMSTILEGLEYRPAFVKVDDRKIIETHIGTYPDQASADLKYPLTDKHDPAVIQYISGQSEKLRAAVLTHTNISFTSSAFADAIQFLPTDKVLAVIPLYHPLGQFLVMHTALWVGIPLILQFRYNIEEIFQTIAEKKITILIGVPSLYQHILEADSSLYKDCSSVRVCITSNNPCPEYVFRRFEEIFHIPLLECYGTVETTFLAVCNRYNEKHRDYTLGQPLSNVEVEIVDEDGTIMPDNQYGEIIIKGPNVMAGYFDNSVKTAETIIDGWFHTGDIGMKDEEGYLFFVDKKEDVIMKGGFPIYPSEVEKILLQHPKIAEVSVVGIHNELYTQEVKACILLKENESASEKEIKDYSKKHLPIYKQPQEIRFVDELPKMSTGKVNKKICRIL